VTHQSASTVHVPAFAAGLSRSARLFASWRTTAHGYAHPAATLQDDGEHQLPATCWMKRGVNSPCSFLRQKRMTLLEIAYLLGFAGPSNFFSSISNAGLGIAARAVFASN